MKMTTDRPTDRPTNQRAGRDEDGRASLNFDQLKERALRLLARRDHSIRELKMKLKQRTHLDDLMFDRLLDYLKSLGYMMNETELAQRWVKQWRNEGRGRRWIEGKLKVKGLPATVLRDDEGELEAARHFLQKKLGPKAATTLSHAEKGKLYRSLVSRGFSSSVVATLIGRP